MELIGIVIAAIVGWKIGEIGVRELKGIGLVAGGWTLVTTAAAVPDISVQGILFSFVYGCAVVGVPFAIAALISRWQDRR